MLAQQASQLLRVGAHVHHYESMWAEARVGIKEAIDAMMATESAYADVGGHVVECKQVDEISMKSNYCPRTASSRRGGRGSLDGWARSLGAWMPGGRAGREDRLRGMEGVRAVVEGLLAE